ncbi:MAG: TetR/AcrR family transcriptional regulator [Syntrophorhabdales bacterium]|jgi:AcrR family transcriptional regulator
MRRTRKETRKNNEGLVPSDDLSLSPSKNAKLIEDKHEQIVTRASKILFEKGFHPTTTRELAEACGMSMGQFYHYISSKDDVLYLLHKHMIKLWRDSLKVSMVESIADPLERLKAALSSSLDFIFEHNKLFRFVITESKNMDRERLRMVLKLDYEHSVVFWRGLLEAANTRKPIKGDIEILANQIVLLQLFQPLRGWTVKHRSPEEIRDTMVDFILRGLGLVDC